GRQLRRGVADVRQLPPRRRAARQGARPPDAGRVRRLPQPLGVDPGHAARTAIDMQVTQALGTLAIAVGLAAAPPAFADDTAIAHPADASRADDTIDLRLTLSTFFYRESGADASALVDQGATLQNASPVRRTFGDLRTELATGGLTLDARIRQTTSDRYQAGAAGGGEYELRTLDYRLGGAATALMIGRQVIDAVGAT